jgi:hypothetical protein
MTRDEQIDLMKECLTDAAAVYVQMQTEADKPYIPSYRQRGMAAMASAFFQYRARQRDAADIRGDTEDNAADVEKD